MLIEFTGSFKRDIKRLADKNIKKRVSHLIKEIEHAASLEAIHNAAKIRGTKNYYRIRIGDYRIGLVQEGKSIVLVRCLHRKDIYRYFP